MDLKTFIKKATLHGTKHIKYFIFQSRSKKWEEKDLVLIFSDGRGGGTWLMEMVSEAVGGLTVFEPFSGDNFGFQKRLSHYDHPFLLKNEKEAEGLRSFFDDILRLKNPGMRAIQFNPFKQLFAKRAVVKFVNRNFILPLLLDQYTFSRKPILLIRNPISIINSRAKYGFDHMETEKEIAIKDFWRINDGNPLMQEMEYLSTLTTNYELYLAEWCLALKPFIHSTEYHDRLHIIYYEDMMAEPAKILDGVMRDYGFSDYKSIDSEKKSASTVRVRQFKAENNYLPGYKERFRNVMAHYGYENYFDTRVAQKLK